MKDGLKLPGNVDSLRAIAEYVMSAATQAGIDKKRAYRLRLAVDEIATNIVTHGYEEADLTGDIEIRSELNEDTLTITLIDEAVAYDPLSHPTPDDLDAPLEERQMGGLGVFLAAKNVDEFKYEFVNGHNHNIFVVNLGQGDE